MAVRRIVFSRKASTSFHHTTIWYHSNKGVSFANSYRASIEKAVAQIAFMPTIGRREGRLDRHICRSLLAHPHTRIYYWYSASEIYIVDLISVQTNHDYK